MTHTKQRKQKVAGYTTERLLGYRKRTTFSGYLTPTGDIRAQFPDGRTIYVNLNEVKLRKSA
jgi:hypothetical protein